MGWVPWMVRSGLYFDRSNLGSDQGHPARSSSTSLPRPTLGSALVRSGWLDGRGPGTDRAPVRPLATAREDYLAADDDTDHLLLDRTAFQRRPFLRLGDGRLLLLSPRFLFSWMGEAPTTACSTRRCAGPTLAGQKRKAALRFTQLHGELMER